MGFSVGSGGNVNKTIDGGTAWVILESGISYWGLNAVHFPGTDTGYIAGEHGTILKTTNGGGFPAGVNNQPSTTNSLKIYPNPSSDKITIETSAKGHISIQSLNGQELLNLPISKPSTQFDITNLPVGVYFMKLTNEKTVQIGKIIKE
jgi:hypothetical protein